MFRTSESSRRAQLLVVDDDRPSRESLCELLSLHYDVRLAENGQAALEAARQSAPDLIVMDVFMPELDGLSAYQSLLRDARTESTPVIFVSAPNEDVAVKCLSAGATDYVAKPVSGRELVARIDRALRESCERRALAELAQTDALTGLANFRALQARLDQEYQRAIRYGYPLSVVSIDLDHLKSINDRFGHEIGNRAIATLARHLRTNLRESDFAARFGGDEFVVILPHQSPSEAAIFAERVRHGMAAVPLLACAEGIAQLSLSVSVGIAGHWKGGQKESAGDLLGASDEALYEAKRRGRNTVVVFEVDWAQPRGTVEGHA